MSTRTPAPKGRVFQIQDESTSYSPSPSNRERLIIPREGQRGPLVWTFDIKEALLSGLILKAIDEGMRANSGYKKQAWEYAAQAVHKKAERPNMELKQIKSKHDSYKKDYKA
jgi:hypothetical protein